ncbi:hypothetical protein POSPLADRAFT_1182402 [Postia placenta MAD-698-R-SB12]|uniref:Auxin efflux carrier n=1 Tax=Postia placenta MAD-698-R-SB12 TaxID=670580 RepID=A0A1X6MYD0_9APHY|nr:hypothetical protein POSPLADRAFT_1182402 [Postia placenta MAD-698-R-SB12]OSX61260.1 hypothetical protein POSPLADRAFT_1182402 [Postia placenta MAD-698-R-SB12]
MNDTPIGPLLQVVFDSILEVFLICVAGYILARTGVLDRKTQKQINRLNVSLFTPSLLFSKVAFFLSPAKLRELWIIPIFFVVTTAVSMIVAYLLSWLLRLKRSQRSFAIAAAMFMNSNSLPIALMQSLVLTVPGLKWGEDDNNNAMVGRALTYLVLYSTLGMMLRWSYGVRLLSSADPEASEAEARPAAPLIESDETAFPNSEDEQRILRHRASLESSESDSDDSKTIVRGRDYAVKDPNSSSFPSSRTQASASAAPSEYYAEEEEEVGYPARGTITEPTSTLWQSRMRRLKHRLGRWWNTFYEFMTVPLWAAILSLIVACIRPLQHALDEHVQPVKGALTAAGNCSIPLTLVVLGAYFYTPPEEGAGARLPSHKTQARARSPSMASCASFMDNMREMFSMRRWDGEQRPKSSEMRPGETKTVLVAVVARMFVTPLLLLPLMAYAAKFDVQEVFADPVFVVSNVLLIASPPALTLAQITQAASGDAFERLISRTIFWSYCIVTPPSTIIFVVVGLIFTKL